MALDVFGRHARHEAIHERAPAPEVVRLGTAEFRESRHAALKAMAVHVAHAGQRHRHAFVTVPRLRIAFEARETPVRDFDADVLRPAFGQQRGCEMKCHVIISCARK